MRRIRIIRPIPPSVLRESEAMRRALVGAVVQVDGPAVAARRERYPGIAPRVPETYEATLDEVLLALGKLGRYEAEMDWRIVAPHIVGIPVECAELIES